MDHSKAIPDSTAPHRHNMQGPELLCICFRTKALRGKYQTTNNVCAHWLARCSLLPRAGWQFTVLLSATAHTHICLSPGPPQGWPLHIHPLFSLKSDQPGGSLQRGTFSLGSFPALALEFRFSLAKGPCGSWGLEDLSSPLQCRVCFQHLQHLHIILSPIPLLAASHCTQFPAWSRNSG